MNKTSKYLLHMICYHLTSTSAELADTIMTALKSTSSPPSNELLENIYFVLEKTKVSNMIHSVNMSTY